MLVYGDVERIEAAAGVRASIVEILGGLERLPPGLERHSELARGFIRASELAQGLADAEFEARGCDARSPLQDAAARLLHMLAQAISQSWHSDFRQGVPLPALVRHLLEGLDYPIPIRTKRAEGYALYGLYPENYLSAAIASGLGPDTQVIGIRSIGAGLAAMVAAALGAAPPITLRPTGHPFRRKVDVAPELTAEMLAGGERNFAVVDEGPGLSGSSFGAVADWLEESGVPPSHIHFFPSHAGPPGIQADPGHRHRWGSAHRHSADMQVTLIETHERAHRLETWVTDLLGPLEAPLQDISGGAWRRMHYANESAWPPADTQLERRKFLARAQGKTWLVKFAGLGEEGLRKLHNGRRLHEAGFSAEIAGMCHGLIVQHWVEGSSLDRTSIGRSHLIETLGAYLGFRSRNFAACNSGASLASLTHMARYNTEQALGQSAAAKLDRVFGDAETLSGRIARVDGDNRLHSWEWLVTADGRLIKTDALDHSAAHDLVGCQDVAWDIAGAAVEHALSPDEILHLAEAVSTAAGRAADPRLIALLIPCYLAFQLGAWSYSAMAVAQADNGRLHSAPDRYAALLSGYLN